MPFPRDGEICAFAFGVERLFPFAGPGRVSLAVIALEFVGHPDQRAVADGPVVAGQFNAPDLMARPPSPMRCRVRLRRSTCMCACHAAPVPPDAMLQHSGTRAFAPQMLSKFARTACQRIGLEAGGYRRDYPRAK